jgi:hypothetical protein
MRWAGPVEVRPTGHRPHRLWRPLLALAAAAAILLVLTGTPPADGAGAALGDPGGHILSELSTIRSAVPAGATRIHVYGSEPHLTASCDTSIPGVSARVPLVSQQSVHLVDAEVAAQLRQAGWGHPTSASGRWDSTDLAGQPVLSDNDIFRWTRRMPHGVEAGASLTVAVPVNGWRPGDPLPWLLAATAQGVGEPHRHCGQG